LQKCDLRLLAVPTPAKKSDRRLVLSDRNSIEVMNSNSDIFFVMPKYVFPGCLLRAWFRQRYTFRQHQRITAFCVMAVNSIFGQSKFQA
jgi:hypothetical protein